MGLESKLSLISDYLNEKSFEFNNYSAVYKNESLGYHVIFREVVRDKVTEEIQNKIIEEGFTFSFTS
jgi:hypothetical protein